jgi:SAM-dependent methyltransferase
MSRAAMADEDFVSRHRAIWAARPELRSVYREWFGRLLGWVGGRRPVVELGSGPGFFKEYFPDLIATDIVSSPWIDLKCDACALPFGPATVGALVMVDVLHHLPRPLRFMGEAARVLQPAGRLAMIEPWITPMSYLLYRFFHHEDCRLRFDLNRPFQGPGKSPLEGNAAIPFQVLRHFRSSAGPLRLVRAEPFLGLAYLSTLGFKCSRPLPSGLVRLAHACERLLDPLLPLAATRILLVWEQTGNGRLA